MALCRCGKLPFVAVSAALISTVAATLNVSGYGHSFGPGSCPGLILQGGPNAGSYGLHCSTFCQQATCTALQKFFNSTYNATTPYLTSWRNRKGWEAFLQQNCTQILATPTAEGTPAYCNWHGIRCCRRLFRPLCNVTNGLVTLQVEVNGLNGSIADPHFQQSIAQLHACGLYSLQLAGNALSGSLDNTWSKLKKLRVLNLAKNMIEGTIPEAFRQLDKLVILQLDRNLMHGTVPSWLSELHSLHKLGLSAFAGRNADGRQGLVGTIPASLGNLRNLHMLTLDSNSLTGHFPPQLCHPNLSALVLRSNSITWNIADLRACTNISFVDFSSNRFIGALPIDDNAWKFRNLCWLDVSSNGIGGTLPKAVYKLNAVLILNFANNRLSGTIDSTISQMPHLVNLDLHGNDLTGTIDESVWYMPRLHSIDLSVNNLTGTISPAIALSYYLATVRLNDNQLTGSIPAEIATLPSLATMDLSGNRFNCQRAGPINTGTNQCSVEDQLLPCFLRLTQYTIPRSDGSNMECPGIERKARAEILSDCASGSSPTRLGNLIMITSLPATELRVQDWQLNPSYYQYQGCKCLGGFAEVWSDNHTMLTCEASTSTPGPWQVKLAVILGSAIAGALLVAAFGLMVWLKLTVQLRRKWQREKELNSNRLKGVPSDGPAAIVVTDVEDYSDLLQKNAPLTIRAMALHNAILRKAVTTHAGYVIEQEGDSWSLAFHRSDDAVAFCLQVQQALQKSSWPSELQELTSIKQAAPEPRSSISASHDSHVPFDPVCQQQAGQSTDSSKFQAATVQSSQQLNVSYTEEDNIVSRGPSLRTLSAAYSIAVPPALDRSLGSKLASFMQYPAGRSSSESISKQLSAEDESPSRYDGAVVPTATDTGDRESRMQPLQSRASTDSAAFSLRGLSFLGLSRSASSSSRCKQLRTTNKTVMGLRVRMGIASGWLAANRDIKTSAVLALAKAVSDMANGGQVLLESRTADAVRDWLSDLSCVDHKGYNEKLLSCLQEVTTDAYTSRPASGSSVRAVAAAAAEHQPTTGDMHHQVLTECQNDASKTVGSVKPGSTECSTTDSPRHTCSKACIAIAASALMHGKAVDGISATDSIHLYSVVAQSLQARSQLWKSDLNLKDDGQQLIKGYFCAPGTLSAAATSLGGLALERPLLPSVTTVFVAVEDGKQLVRRHECVAKRIHNVMCRIMQAVLLSFSDGYLCREQEAVLRYIVAFKEPARAAEWCLLVQNVLQYVPWPAEVMEAVNGASRASHSPRVVLGARRTTPDDGVKRPSLKMGLADGVPDSIAPDHLGRADYLGTSVNLAARITDAAAQPEQVLMSCDLADVVFSVWRYEAEQRRDGHEAASVKPSAEEAEQFSGRVMHVGAYHVGTYAFTGSGETDVVCLTSDALLGTTVPLTAVPPKGSKGTLVAAAKGPVIGMQDRPVVLPDVLHEFQQAWSRAGCRVEDPQGASF